MATFNTLPAEIRNAIYEMSFAANAKDSPTREMVELMCCWCKDSEYSTRFAQGQRKNPEKAVGELDLISFPVLVATVICKGETDCLVVQMCRTCSRAGPVVAPPEVTGAVALLMASKQMYSEAFGKHCDQSHSNCS